MDIRAISSIQHMFKRKRVTFCFNNNPYRAFFVNITQLSSNPDNFTQLKEHIQMKIIIKLATFFLNRLYSFLNTTTPEPVDVIAPRLSARDFLAMFLIASCPHDTFYTRDLDELQEDLHEYAIDVRDNIIVLLDNQDNECMRKFVKSLNIYANCYMHYMIIDKQRCMEQMMNKWANDQEMLKAVCASDYSDQQKDNIMFIIKDQQSKMKDTMKMYVKDITDDFLEKYSEMFITTKKLMIDAYWDNIKDNILDNKYDMLVLLLGDIKNNILSMVKNHEFHKRFTDIFDENFIGQLLENTHFNQQQVISYGEFVVDTLNELHSPDRAKEMMSTWQRVRDGYDGIDLTIEILKFVVAEVAMLEKDMFVFRELQAMIE